jgi:hypothetical protein
METTHFPPPAELQEPRIEQENQDWEYSSQKSDATKIRSPAMSSQLKVRQQRGRTREQQSTIALICGWIVKHQLGTHTASMEGQGC